MPGGRAAAVGKRTQAKAGYEARVKGREMGKLWAQRMGVPANADFWVIWGACFKCLHTVGNEQSSPLSTGSAL